MFTDWLGVGKLILNSPWSKNPCRKWTKNPVLALDAPWPSSLWINPNFLPGNGACSFIEPSSTSALVISKSKFLPLTFLLNAKTGRSEPSDSTLYCFVKIPFTVSEATGLPNLEFCPNAAFITFINCSYQSALDVSAQLISAFPKSKLLLSITFSVVDIATIFNNPLAHWFLVAL